MVQLEELVRALNEHPRYSFVSYLAKGAFGSVILADDRCTGEKVALKFLRRSQISTDGLVANEVLHHMRMVHPHVVQLQEVFLTDTHLVLVMEWVPGGDLSCYVPAGRGLSEDDARWLFCQLLFALDYTHRMGVASRDIKLENLLVDNSASRPILKLSDFGLSIECNGPASPYESIVGTPIYMPPEVVVSYQRQAIDAKKADVWSAGVLLYILLTGTTPFQRASDAALTRKRRMTALLQRIVAVDYIMPKGLSPECSDLLTSMLVADPAARPSVQDLLRSPWCSQGLDTPLMLACNDTFVTSSLLSPPSPEVVREVYSILEEAAAMCPATPTQSAEQLNTSANSSEDAGTRAWVA